jgi:transposase
MAPTSDQERWAIVAAWDQHGSIAKAAHVVGKHRNVVRRWVQRFRETGNVSLGKSTGRPPAMTSESAKTALKLLLEEGGTADSVANKLLSMGITAKKVAKTTLIMAARRAAVSEGTPIRALRGKPAKQLTQNTMKKRLAFAKKNRTRSWRNVMFTDRKKFLFSHPGAKVLPVSWVLKGSSNWAYTVNHPQVLNVYAGLTSYGMTKCHIVAGTSKHKTEHKNKKGEKAKNITASEYAEVLNTTLLPEATRIFSTQGIGTFVLQQDNDPTHKVATTTVAKWNGRHASSISVLKDWPPNSPDLNPIENVWGIVQAKVNALGCKTFDEFKKAVQDQLKAVTKKQQIKLVRSMKGRLAQVIGSGGGKINY